MARLTKDSREFIESLISHGVEFLIVGGHALAYHGYPRYTGDIDFWVRCTPENAERLGQVLAQFGFSEIAALVEAFSKPGKMVQFGMPPNRIDILSALSGLTFEEAWKDRAHGQLDGVSAPFLGAKSLIRNKLASGRPKDIADVDELSKRLDRLPDE